MHNKLQDPRPDEAMLTKTEGIFAEEHKVYHNVVIITFQLAFEFHAPVLHTPGPCIMRLLILRKNKFRYK